MAVLPPLTVSCVRLRYGIPADNLGWMLTATPEEVEASGKRRSMGCGPLSMQPSWRCTLTTGGTTAGQHHIGGRRRKTRFGQEALTTARARAHPHSLAL